LDINVAKLIMCKGLPGSGKSTWAKEKVYDNHLERGYYRLPSVVRVNKDDIRAELTEKHGWTWSREGERDVIARRDQLILEAFKGGAEVVISDDTNLAPKHENALREIARQSNAFFELKDFTKVPIEVCVERDSKREKPIGEKVIRDMAEEFLVPSDLVNRTGNPQLFLDLDGVLADFDGFIEKELGIENNRENERPDFWDIVRTYKGRLYYDMPPIPRARDLFEALRPFSPIILTGCPWSLPTAGSDKRQWVKENIDKDVQVITCRSRSKSKYGKAGDILVDDWPKYRDLWTGMGGIFVHHTDPDKTIEEVKKLYEHKA
jgi:predicted kinase